jgi:hypothetical protein
MRPLARVLVWTLPLLILPTVAKAQQLCGKPVDKKWWTAPEREGWKKTSTSQDVQAFLAGLEKAHPGAFRTSKIGTSLRGRPIQLATVLRPSNDKLGKRLRAVIIANIHGGEVEGKEAVQIILREIALGEHKDILAACDIWFVPIYNVDGNDEIQEGNRSSQNGPSAVGVRRNSQSLDLNRDFVKIETNESRALLGLFRRVDPHFFMDLHTTNGSPHGYHLTYAPSLSTNLDVDIDDFMHEVFAPAVRAAVLKNHSFRIMDYGNFSRGRGDPRSWTTYAHTPRYAINYFGLRNRLSLLSEAYSYLPFKQRALVTRAFVLESLRELVRHREGVFAVCEQADQRLITGGEKFGYASQLREAKRRKILVGSVSREGSRRVAGKDFREVEMDVRIRFEATKTIALPEAWAIPNASDELRRTLLLHDVEVHRTFARAEVRAESFEIEGRGRPRGRGMRYEGHQLVTLRGKLKTGKHTLPVGTLIVFGRQRRARVAAQLLEGHSEDSLTTWNFFDASLTGDKAAYPVLRVINPSLLGIERLFLKHGDTAIDAAYSPAPRQLPDNIIVLTAVCTKTGTRSRRGGYDTNVSWRGREIVYGLGPKKFEDVESVESAVKAIIADQANSDAPFLLRPGNTITNAELLGLAKMLNRSGVKKVFLKHEPE